MKIVTIVGIPGAGKTSTIAALAQTIRRRGKKVGTCKSAYSPTYSIASFCGDAMRQRRSGSELVCSRAKGETAFLYPEALPLSKVLEAFRGCDYVLLEGDYFAPVPRIVCGHDAQDALPRTNSRTIAYAGRIGAREDVELSLPRFDPLTEEGAQALLDLIDAKIPNILPCSLLDEELPPVSCVMNEELYPDAPAHHQQETHIQVLIDGENIPLTPENKEAIFDLLRRSR